MSDFEFYLANYGFIAAEFAIVIFAYYFFRWFLKRNGMICSSKKRGEKDMMKLLMLVDVDLEESGWNPDAARVILDEFAKRILVNGAENEQISLTFRGVMEID